MCIRDSYKSSENSYENDYNENNQEYDQPNTMSLPSGLQDLLGSKGQGNFPDLSQMPDLPPNLGEGLAGLFGSK